MTQQKGVWQVFGQTIDGEKQYIVGRQIDMAKPLHSGNIEYCGDYTTCRDAASRAADYLNEKELQRGEP